MLNSKYTAMFFVMCLIAVDAQAYIGPGPGLSMIGSLFTLLGGVALALLMVLIYPIRLLMKRRKANKKPE